MTKKDYVALAAVVSACADRAERQRWAVALGALCAAGNPRFDWAKWYQACGVVGGVEAAS